MSRAMLPSDANVLGNVHGGVVMKFIDECAGATAARHARNIAVTASIDRLDFKTPVYVGELVTCKGCVNLVGRTSMEVGVRVEAEDLYTGALRHTASAYLTFVALDKERRPTPAPQLILETDDDHRRNGEALKRREMRIQEKKRESEG